MSGNPDQPEPSSTSFTPNTEGEETAAMANNEETAPGSGVERSAFLTTTIRPVATGTPTTNSALLVNVPRQEVRNQAVVVAPTINVGLLGFVNPIQLPTNNALGAMISPVTTTVVPLALAQPSHLNFLTTNPPHDASSAILLNQAANVQNCTNLNAALGNSQVSTTNLHPTALNVAASNQDNIMPSHTSFDTVHGRDINVGSSVGVTNPQNDTGGSSSLADGNALQLSPNNPQISLASLPCNSASLDHSHTHDDDGEQGTTQFISSFPLQKQGRPATFVNDLYQMLLDLEEEPNGTGIASFSPGGKSFAIHKADDFVKNIIPKYFKMSSLSSFRRQLNMYGFRQVPFGPDIGAFYHKHFIRGQPELLSKVQRFCKSSNKKGSS